MTRLLLIHPPVALASEPPLGVATLAGALGRAGVAVEVIDANIEALDFLIASVRQEEARSSAERRAVAQRDRSLRQLRTADGYRHIDRHGAAVSALQRLLGMADREVGRIGLTNYSDPALSPICSRDLLAAAERSEDSPFAAYFEQLADRVVHAAPRVIGISLNYLHQALPAMALAGTLRRRLASCTIIMGGSLIGCWRARLSQEAFAPWIDRLVFDQGERILAAAAGATSNVPGPTFVPDYSGAPWRRYLSPERVAPAATSLGCYWSRCRYCPEAQGRGFTPVPRSRLPAVLDEVRRGSRAQLLHLTDSALPPAHLDVLAAQRWSARWYGFSRFHRALSRPGRCRRLRRAGCEMLQLGLESGSPEVLRHLRKGIDLTDASAALRSLADADIAVYLYVMFGVPGETERDARRTARFVVDHADCVCGLNVSLLSLPADCPVAPGVEPVPFAGDHDLSLYSGYVSRTGWDRPRARRFIDREFGRLPEVAALLRRTPRFFGANHAVFVARAARDKLR